MLLRKRYLPRHYGNHLLAIEEPIASCTGRHAHATIFTLGWQTQIFCGGAGCNYKRLCLKGFALFQTNGKRPFAKVGLNHDAPTDIGTQPYGLTPSWNP